MTRLLWLISVAMFTLLPASGLLAQPEEGAEKKEEQKSAAEREAEAEALITEIDEHMTAERYLEALELLGRLRADYADTEAYQREATRLGVAHKRALEEANKFRNLVRGKFEQGKDGVPSLSYAFDSPLEIGDFESDGKVSTADGYLVFGSGARLWHRLAFPGALEIELFLAPRSRLELWLSDEPSPNPRVGFAVRLQAGRDAVVKLAGREVAKGSIGRAEKINLIWKQQKLSVLAEGKPVCEYQHESVPLELGRLGMKSLSGSSRLESLRLTGAMALPPGTEGIPFLPLDIPLQLLGEAADSVWVLQGDWKLQEGRLSATESGNAVVGKTAGLETYAYRLQLEIYLEPPQSEGGGGSRFRDMYRTLLSLWLPTPEGMGIWDMRATSSTFRVGEGNSDRLANLPFNTWTPVDIVIGSERVEASFGGRRVLRASLAEIAKNTPRNPPRFDPRRAPPGNTLGLRAGDMKTVHVRNVVLTITRP